MKGWERCTPEFSHRQCSLWKNYIVWRLPTCPLDTESLAQFQPNSFWSQEKFRKVNYSTVSLSLGMCACVLRVLIQFRRQTEAQQTAGGHPEREAENIRREKISGFMSLPDSHYSMRLYSLHNCLRYCSLGLGEYTPIIKWGRWDQQVRKHIKKKEQSTDLGRVLNGTPYSLYSAFILTGQK